MIKTHLITVQVSRVTLVATVMTGDRLRSKTVPKITDEVDLKVAKFIVVVQMSRTK